MTRLEERIRSGLQETAERIPDTAPTRAARRLRASRPAGVWAAVAAAVGVMVLFTPILFLGGSDPGTTPAGDPPSPFLDTWVSIDGDGSTQTMVIEASEDESVEMLVHDDYASVCSGAPSTMTGTGGFEGDNKLVFPSPVLTCDDGSVPKVLSGPPLEEQLKNLTFTRDPGTDTLTDKFGPVWTRVVADPSPEPTTPPPSEAEVTELLNGFLEARIAGEGAEQYLNSLYPDILWEDIPLLYATSSGAPYERAEFEPVLGVEWPLGFMAFKVRLFAGDTVVEQLFFMPHDDPKFFPADGGLGLEYQPHGFATHIAPTTEDGQPLAVSYDAFDGEVTLHATHPWVFYDGSAGRLIPEGPGVGPTTDGAQRQDWDHLVLIADPPPVGPDCQTGPSPADAAALAKSIRSYTPGDATAPVAVSAGGAEALMMDVKIAAGAPLCVPFTVEGSWAGVLYHVFDVENHASAEGATADWPRIATGRATGDWMRLYLFDAPEGSSMRILAIAIVAPESRFERAVEAAAPVVDSIEFHGP